jgi:hypothetical protein
MKSAHNHILSSITASVLLIGLGVQFISGVPLGRERSIALAAPRSQGNIRSVASTADSGPGTLRQALLDAQSGDIITFDPLVFPPSAPVTISLTSSLPHINQGNLTIDASNAGVILDGSQVSGEWTAGIEIDSEHNIIRGLQAVHFTGPGIQMNPSAKFNTIGGNMHLGAGPLGQGNLFSDNSDGIAIFGASDNTILGNLIGTDVSGAPLANRTAGIFIEQNGKRNVIGPDNIIAYNGDPGVDIRSESSFGNTITQNSIYDNQRKGIQLFEGSSYNTLPPFIFDFDLSAGTLAGTACANCVVEIFSDSEDQGEKYEGRITADGSGSFNFSKGSSFSGPHLTATATDTDANTSEFSSPTSGDSRSLVIQEGNNMPRSLLETKRSVELRDNLIGDMTSLRLGFNTEDDVDYFIEYLNRIGYKWIRLSLDFFDWSEVEDTGEYSQFYINPIQDRMITRLANQGVTILYCLVFWDQEIEPVPTGYTRFRTEEEIQRYLDYARFIVRHFKGRIQYYEILNESFGPSQPVEGFSQQHIELADYINLVRRVTPVIRAEDPEAKIVAGPAPALFEQATYDYEMGILSSDEIMPIVDAVSWHTGSYPVEYSEHIDHLYQVPETILEIKDVATAHGFKGEYIPEEIQWPTDNNPSPSTPWFMYSEMVAAKYFGRGIIDHRGMGLPALLAGTANEGNLPKMDVIRNLNTLLAGAEPVTLPVEVGRDEDIKQYTFSLPDGSYLIALWRDDFAAEDDPGTPTTVTISGITEHTVTGIDVLSSYQQQLITSEENGDLVIRNLLVKDYPVILHITPPRLFLPLILKG